MATKYLSLWITALGLMLFAGCDNSGQDSGSMAIPDESAAIVDDNLAVAKAGSSAVDSANGVFEIGWHQFFGPLNQTPALRGGASAVVFDGTQGSVAPHFTRAGKDVGEIAINYSGNHTVLNKKTNPRGGTFYSTLARMFQQQNPSNIEFVPNTLYEFEVSGTASFAPLKASFTTPSALMSVTSHKDNDAVSASNDLTIKWTGGTTAGVVIRVNAHRAFGPGGMHGRGPGGRHGGPMVPPVGVGEGYIVKLDTNPGEYTIPAAKIQEVLSNVQNITEIGVCVSQFTTTEISHSTGLYKLVMRNGDRRVLSVK
jgi:hypothetical protein